VWSAHTDDARRSLAGRRFTESLALTEAALAEAHDLRTCL